MISMLPNRSLLFSRLGRLVERLLAVVGAVFLIFHFAFDLEVMTSDSMAPALQGTNAVSGDRILLEKVSGWMRKPKRWEIYAYDDDESNPVMKRVVGLPGERIAIKHGKVYINGRPIDRPAGLPPVRYYPYGNLTTGKEVDCGNGYFMMGDASNDSFDSRFTGVVDCDRFRGRACWILGPAPHRGQVR